MPCSGSGTSRSSSPGPARTFTRAFMWVSCPACGRAAPTALADPARSAAARGGRRLLGAWDGRRTGRQALVLVRADDLGVRALPERLVEGQDRCRVECLEREDTVPHLGRVRPRHVVETDENRPDLRPRVDAAYGARRKAGVEVAQCRLTGVGRARAVTAIEDNERAVLQVVDPALRDRRIARGVHARLDGALATAVVVPA